MKMKRNTFVGSVLALCFVVIFASASVVPTFTGYGAPTVTASTLTRIDEYEVMYSSNGFVPRIWLINGGTYIGQLIFEPDGSALPPDSYGNGEANIYYHLEDFQNCIDLLRNENPVYLLWAGSGAGNENGIKTMAEPVGEGEGRSIRQFDFGTSSSPVESGFVQVTESSAYNAASGYGWDSIAGLGSRDRGAPDNLQRDFVFSSTDHTFNVDLLSGHYKVTLVIGDNSYTHDLIDVYAENVLQVNHLTVSAGTFSTQIFTVTLSDGQLNIKFHDAGGSDASWVINAIKIELAS